MVQPLWLEKLSRWEEAKTSYLRENNSYRDQYPNCRPPQYKQWMLSELGSLRCLQALGEYSELLNSAEILFNDLKFMNTGDKLEKYCQKLRKISRN